MEKEDIGFAEFESAFSEEDGYQTEPVEEQTDPDSEQDDGNDAQEGEETEDTGEEEAADAAEEESGSDGEDGVSDAGETFTIKVNKEERTVSREEMVSLAQKGADYDRVKEQLTQSRQQNQTLQEQVDKSQGVMEVMEAIAAGANMPLEQFVEQLHVNFLMKGGKTEGEAREKIRADKAEKQLNATKAKETAEKTAVEDAQTRAQREIAEFHKEFPNVELTEELCNKLMPDVQSGMSLSNAYRKQENARKDSEIAELKRQLEAEKQNKKNRSNSPGSQKDSGGRRSRSPEDEFFAAFES